MNLQEQTYRIREIMGLIVESEKRIKFDMNIPEDILGIKDIFKKNGYNLYVVGGAVRDSIMGKNPKDYDLVTDAVPDNVEQMMNTSGYKTLPTGKAFGVINVFTNMGEYEIATMREDIGSGRRPDSVKFTDIETDSKRRDLTINALYYDIDKREIVDFVGGVDDLKNNVVRTVGRPEDRFNEDRLRILRVFRFAGRMGSKLDDSVRQSLQKDSSLEGISGERIRDEFLKGITSSKSVKYFLGLLDEFNLFEWIFKGLEINRNFIENKNPVIVISCLLTNNNPQVVQKRLNELKYTYEENKDVFFLINLINLKPENSVTLKKLQKNTSLSDNEIKEFGNFQNIDGKLLDTFINFKLSVKGEDIIKQSGVKPGKELGDIINKMEYNNFVYELTRTNI